MYLWNGNDIHSFRYRFYSTPIHFSPLHLYPHYVRLYPIKFNLIY